MIISRELGVVAFDYVARKISIVRSSIGPDLVECPFLGGLRSKRSRTEGGEATRPPVRTVCSSSAGFCRIERGVLGTGREPT